MVRWHFWSCLWISFGFHWNPWFSKNSRILFILVDNWYRLGWNMMPSKSVLNLTLAPIYTSQPSLPLLSLDIDISPIILPQVYVGFLPQPANKCNLIMFWVGAFGKRESLIFHIFLVKNNHWRRNGIGCRIVHNRSSFGDHNYNLHPHDLEEKRGSMQGVVWFYREGGFGKVHRGVLPVSNVQVAVKRISQFQTRNERLCCRDWHHQSAATPQLGSSSWQLSR